MPDFPIKFSGLPGNKSFVVTFRICAFFFAVWGILARVGVFKSVLVPVVLLTYTIQSNILVAVFFGVLSVKTVFFREKQAKSPGNPYGFFSRLSAFVTFAIVVTMLVFWFVLAPLIPPGTLLLTAPDNLAVHLITPLFMLADYLMFSNRGCLKKYDPLLFAVVPYVYLVEAFTIGLTHTVRYDSIGHPSYYPYIFLDVDKFGAWVILMVAAMTLVFIVLASLWRHLDNKIALKNLR